MASSGVTLVLYVDDATSVASMRLNRKAAHRFADERIATQQCPIKEKKFVSLLRFFPQRQIINEIDDFEREAVVLWFTQSVT
jgi:hypothetical protein